MNYLIPKSVEELSSEQFEKLIKVYNKNYFVSFLNNLNVF